jgi:membrane protein
MATVLSKSRSRIPPWAGYALLALITLAQRAVLGRKQIELLDTFGESSPARPRGVAIKKQENAGPLTSPRTWWSLLKNTATSWMAHKAARLGAALAYYSIFSLGPLMLVVVTVTGLIFGQEAAQGHISAQLETLLGEQGAKGVENMLAGAGKPSEGIFATILGVATLLFAALGVVVQLKDALNTVWEVEEARKSGIWNFVRTYAISLAGVLSLAFLLLVSLVITAAISALGDMFAPYLPEAVFHIVSFAMSFAVMAALFAMMFKWLPDAQIEWRDVIPGAILTSVLFEIGRFLIGFYIGKQGLESTYGAAASIVVILIWIYYSAQLVLFGAEFTRVYAQRYGAGTRPEL